MLDADHLRLMEGGALIVGLTLEDGAPYATRGWGLRVEDPDPDRECLAVVHLLLPADDATGIEGVAPGRAVAVTAADVMTLVSAQFKGRSLGTAPATEDDLALSERYFAGFSEAVTRSDGQPRELLARLVPHELVRCTVEVHEAYDQTPGPGAGQELDR
ncbi:hypothetical protein [Dermatobacter hominis]|uniref:hypothetical protein n=1 Tax=Dermatobacter hominis TaxID=2884263 RepID=UPI001D11060D|nr:hypothetical protein [Dermatobacter hominis]UDY34642.1 hypothetical protein LH044_15020 [Dermatobacter hominis]